MNGNNGNETALDIFPGDIFKSDNISFDHNILKCFNDFHNRNFPVSCLNLTQTMEMKQS